MPPKPFSLKKIYPRTHSGLISEFGLHFVKNGIIEEDFAKILSKSEIKRVKADYDIDFTPSLKDSKNLLYDAQKFLKRIKKAIIEIS
jgi:uncharacterized protein (UPF0332 family)